MPCRAMAYTRKLVLPESFSTESTEASKTFFTRTSEITPHIPDSGNVDLDNFEDSLKSEFGSGSLWGDFYLERSGCQYSGFFNLSRIRESLESI